MFHASRNYLVSFKISRLQTYLKMFLRELRNSSSGNKGDPSIQTKSEATFSLNAANQMKMESLVVINETEHVRQFGRSILDRFSEKTDESLIRPFSRILRWKQ